LKLQFHCVPEALTIVSVPLGALPLADPEAEPEAEPDDPAELQAASAAASRAAAPVRNKRLIGGALHSNSRGLESLVSTMTSERHVRDALFEI
jgi:hypothetical protein